jgi:hypothetical protein
VPKKERRKKTKRKEKGVEVTRLPLIRENLFFSFLFPRVG